MKTTLAILLGLCAGLLANDPAAIIRLVLAFGVGVGCTLLWVDRRAVTEKAIKAHEQETRHYKEALVAHGFNAAKGNPAADLLTTQRTAIPPVPPKVTP